MLYFTADTHFGHRLIIKHCDRPMVDADAMDEIMIKKWNAVVSDDDTVYHLGDFAICGLKRAQEIRSRLKGHIIVILGSHDKMLRDSMNIIFCDRLMLKHEGQDVFLNHYCHKVWPGSHYDSWHLFGHSHGGLNDYAAQEGKLMDVGVDTNHFTPVSWDIIKEVMSTRPLNFNSLKRKDKACD
jgi:calcineurin-like phosphoesterase family protein